MSNWNRRRFLQSAVAAPVLGAVAATADEQPKVVGASAALKDAIRTQVLVVGAGASGVPAALAAARSGAKVVLLEEDTLPGGAPVDMYVTMPCGGPSVGIYEEMIRNLDRDFHLTGQPRVERKVGPIFTPSAHAQVILRMILAEPNVDLWCSAPVTEVLVSEGSRNRVRGVVVSRADGRRQVVEADVVIDATGLGIVASMAGCKCLYGTDAKSDFNEPMGPEKSSDQVQVCTLMIFAQRLRPEAKLDPAKLKGPCMSDGNNAALSWAGTVACRDTRDPVEVAKSHREAMLKIEPEIAYLYEQGYTAHVAPKLGVRETRRVVGDHMLSVNDMTLPKRRDDTVALGNYGLDSWGDKHGKFGTKITMTPGCYGIPMGSLITKDMENLMVVGKSLSATHLAMSAVRVQCIVAQMGQAAGVSAALAVARKTQPRSVAAADVQSKLKTMGIPL